MVDGCCTVVQMAAEQHPDLRLDLEDWSVAKLKGIEHPDWRLAEDLVAVEESVIRCLGRDNFLDDLESSVSLCLLTVCCARLCLLTVCSVVLCAPGDYSGDSSSSPLQAAVQPAAPVGSRKTAGVREPAATVAGCCSSCCICPPPQPASKREYPLPAATVAGCCSSCCICPPP
jgi:hypothetical protein